MNDQEIVGRELNERGGIAKIPMLAAVVALLGIADAVYLTVHHYTAVPVQCVEGFDCAAVLTSEYAEVSGVPLAAFGALAYFSAFSLALLTAFGRRTLWNIFGAQVGLMAIFTLWLVYLQAFVIRSYCQYCLISALITFTLLTIFLTSKFARPK